MKLKIQTLTGETTEIEVGKDSTIKDVKRKIYETGTITQGAVRILIGPDESKLSELQVKDGDILNILIEPDKQINIQLIHDFHSFSHKLSHATTVHELKQLLVAKKQLRLAPEEFELVAKQLHAFEEDTLPLHYYGVEDGSALSVRKNYLGLVVENQKGEELFIRVPKKSTVGELKQRIVDIASCGKVDVSLFAAGLFSKYRKLGAEDQSPISEVLWERDRLYLIENKFCKTPENLIQNLGLNRKICGIEVGDTVLSIKLRAQDQLDILAEEIVVKKSKVGATSTSNDSNQVEECTDNCVLEKDTSFSITWKAPSQQPFFKFEIANPMACGTRTKTFAKSKASSSKQEKSTAKNTESFAFGGFKPIDLKFGSAASPNTKSADFKFDVSEASNSKPADVKFDGSTSVNFKAVDFKFGTLSLDASPSTSSSSTQDQDSK